MVFSRENCVGIAVARRVHEIINCCCAFEMGTGSVERRLGTSINRLIRRSALSQKDALR